MRTAWRLMARRLLLPVPTESMTVLTTLAARKHHSRGRVGPSHRRSSENRRPYLTQGVCMLSKRSAFTAATAVGAMLFLCADVAHAQGRGRGPGGGHGG